MKPQWISCIFLLAGLSWSQFSSASGSTNSNSTPSDPRQVMETFCSTHTAECAQLKSLHEAARQACSNRQNETAACRQARDAVHAQMQKLESLGLPRPPRPPGPPPGEGDRPPPPDDAGPGDR